MSSDNESEIEQKKDELQDSMEVDASSASVPRTFNLQKFWLDNPVTWFNLAELQLASIGVKTDIQKFAHILNALSPEACDKISDVLETPPAQNKYSALKQALISRFAISDETRLERLLTGTELGDMKPSDALRRIRTLAGGSFNDRIIKTLWVRRLPEVITISIVAQPEEVPLKNLSEIADRIYDSLSRNKHLAVVSTRESRPRERGILKQQREVEKATNSNMSTLQTVDARIAQLERRMNTFFNSKSPSHSKYPQRSFTRSSSRSRARSKSRVKFQTHIGDICWYHHTYGKNAHHCNKPCKFIQSNDAKGKASTSFTHNDNQKNQ